MKRALVLGGGGSYGIAWESGLLAGLADAGVDVRKADFMVGTSAGSQVGAVVASGLEWNEIWARQVDPERVSRYIAPSVDMPSLFRLYAQIQAEAATPEQWLTSLGTLSRYTVAVSEAARLAEIADRLQLSVWPDRLGVVGVDSRSGKRVVWDKSSGVELLQAVAASCALPGVYPAVMIGQGQYCDGGVYSLENADVTEGYAKVLILKVGLPIATPFTLDDQVEFLRRSGSQVEVVEPDAEVVAVLRRTGGNALNPELRAPVAHAAWAQGQSLSKRLAAFWNGLSS